VQDCAHMWNLEGSLKPTIHTKVCPETAKHVRVDSVHKGPCGMACGAGVPGMGVK